MAGRREQQASAALVVLVGADTDETTSHQRLEGCGKRGAIHPQKRRNLSHDGRVSPVQRVHQRELAMGEAERSKRVIEAPCQSAGRSLNEKAKATIANLKRSLERQGRLSGHRP